MSGQQDGPGPLHPSNHWGPFADDPWSPLLDMVDEAVWQQAVLRSRALRRQAPTANASNDPDASPADVPAPG